MEHVTETILVRLPFFLIPTELTPRIQRNLLILAKADLPQLRKRDLGVKVWTGVAVHRARAEIKTVRHIVTNSKNPFVLQPEPEPPIVPGHFYYNI